MVTLEDTAPGLVYGGQLAAREAVREVVSSGFRPLDALLPAGGVRRGSLIEWLAGEAAGGGAASLACAVACRLGRQADRPGAIVVVDRTGWFHPPAVLPWLGGAPGATRLIVARPAHDDDEIWAIDQALRCVGVAAVLAWPRAAVGPGGCLAAARHRFTQPWAIAMRRWQLAARSSDAVGLFVRPVTARAEPSWAEARIAVAALSGGTLLERRLRLMPVGGVWGAGACGDERATETVLDLTRGVERTGYQGGRQGPAGGVTRAGESRGAACRAS